MEHVTGLHFAFAMTAAAAILLGALAVWLWRRTRVLERLVAGMRQAIATGHRQVQDLETRQEEEAAARRQTEEKLRGYLALMDTLIHTIAHPIYYKDAGEVIRGCNRAFAEEVLGLVRDRIIGSNFRELAERIPPELASTLHNHERRMLEKRGIHSFETEVPCADGQAREFLFSLAAVYGPEGRPDGSVAVMLDLTERNRASRDRLQKEKFQGVLETAGAVCHELNQPLQVISGYAEMALAETDPTDRFNKMAGQISAQVERIADITGKLQRITRYKTLEYDKFTRIIDIHHSSDPKK
jgi:PAS domain S-box-containing protein